MEIKTQLTKYEISYILVPTFAYWAWEIIASGNIRIDLILIYPILFIIYIKTLWRTKKVYSIFIAIAFMIINILYSILSYEIFNKYHG